MRFKKSKLDSSGMGTLIWNSNFCSSIVLCVLYHNTNITGNKMGNIFYFYLLMMKNDISHMMTCQNSCCHNCWCIVYRYIFSNCSKAIEEQYKNWRESKQNYIQKITLTKKKLLLFSPPVVSSRASLILNMKWILYNIVIRALFKMKLPFQSHSYGYPPIMNSFSFI